MTTDLRERILDTALGLMAEQGSTATSMRQLAKACDVQVAALYHYFDSKDALLTAVIAERNYSGRLADPPELDRSAPATERLIELFGVLWDGAIEEEAVWRLLLGEGIRSEPAALPVGRALLVAVRVGVGAWIRDWIPELDHPDAVADAVIAQMFLGFLRYMFEPEADPATIGRDAAASLRLIIGERG